MIFPSLLLAPTHHPAVRQESQVGMVLRKHFGVRPSQRLEGVGTILQEWEGCGMNGAGLKGDRGVCGGGKGKIVRLNEWGPMLSGAALPNLSEVCVLRISPMLLGHALGSLPRQGCRQLKWSHLGF